MCNGLPSIATNPLVLLGAGIGNAVKTGMEADMQKANILPLLKGDALIQANFHLNHENLQVSEWSKLYAKAFWLEEWRLRNQVELFKVLFGGD